MWTQEGTNEWGEKVRIMGPLPIALGFIFAIAGFGFILYLALSSPY